MHLPVSHYLAQRAFRPRRSRGRVGAVPMLTEGRIMKVKLASDIPFEGELVVVDEDDYAATRTPEAFDASLAELERLSKIVHTNEERVAIDETLFSIEGARAVREVAATPAELAKVEKLAAEGNADAKALVVAVNVAAASDMKEDARDVARGLKAGHGAAVRTAQAVARAAASPGEKQGWARQMVGLIEECVGEACEVG